MRIRKRPVLRIGNVVKVRSGPELCYDLPSELSYNGLIEGRGRRIWSGNVFRRRGILSVVIWKGKNESWCGLGPGCWVLGEGKHKVLKCIRGSWVAGVVQCDLSAFGRVNCVRHVRISA